MKFINNIPQFENKDFIDNDDIAPSLSTSKANQKLREAFAERVCVKCKNYFNEYKNPKWTAYCRYTGLDWDRPKGPKPEQFSCASWAKKEG